MAHAGDVGRALTGAEQAAFKVDLDSDGHAARKFFNLSERYERWRDYRVDPRRPWTPSERPGGRRSSPPLGSRPRDPRRGRGRD
jgi:hypothetical protein